MSKNSGENVRVDSLRHDGDNSRSHGRRNLDSIKTSLRRFGQRKPIVVGLDNVVQAGNGTLEAAREIGWEYIWIVRSELTGDEARAFALADNRTAELAEWDFDRLRASLAELEGNSQMLAATGFTESEIARLTADESTTPVSAHERRTSATSPEPCTEEHCPTCGRVLET